MEITSLRKAFAELIALSLSAAPHIIFRFYYDGASSIYEKIHDQNIVFFIMLPLILVIYFTTKMLMYKFLKIKPEVEPVEKRNK